MGVTNENQKGIFLIYLYLELIKYTKLDIKIFTGPPRGKHDGVIGHISKRENRNWIEKFCCCVIDQSGIQRDWVNLTWT